MLIKHCNTVRYELQEDTKLREIIVLRSKFKSFKSKIAQKLIGIMSYFNCHQGECKDLKKYQNLAVIRLIELKSLVQRSVSAQVKNLNPTNTATI